MKRQAETPKPRPVARSWDNSGLRHRVEGKAIDGIDVQGLQSSAAARDANAPRRRLRRRS